MGVFNFNLPEEERPLIVAKAHWVSYSFSWLKVILTGGILGMLITFSWPFWWENKWGRVGIVVFLVAAVLYCLLDFWKRFLTTYVVTPCRIIDITQEKILKRVITEISLEEIGDIIIKPGNWINKWLKKGNILIKLKDEKGVMVFYDILNPDKVKDILTGLQEETSSIINKKGEECDVIMKDDRKHAVPLTYSYYGDRQERGKKNGNGLHRTVRGNGLVVVKKSKEKKEKSKK